MFSAGLPSNVRSRSKIAPVSCAKARLTRRALSSRRLPHIRQRAEFSLPCLGVYHWLRTQAPLTPARQDRSSYATFASAHLRHGALASLGNIDRSPARCIHRPQRDTLSAGYRLLVSRASTGASRELSSRRSPAHPSSDRLRGSLRSGDTTPHTCAISPTFRYGAFRFVAFALAAFLSARLTAYGNNAQTCILQQFRGVCPRLLCRRHGNVVWFTDGRTRMTGERTPSGYIDSYDNDKRYQKTNHSRPQVLRPRHPPCNPFNRTKHRNEEK